MTALNAGPISHCYWLQTARWCLTT